MKKLLIIVLLLVGCKRQPLNNFNDVNLINDSNLIITFNCENSYYAIASFDSITIGNNYEIINKDANNLTVDVLFNDYNYCLVNEPNYAIYVMRMRVIIKNDYIVETNEPNLLTIIIE